MVVPFTRARARLSELADRVERENDRILVTRRGRPAFVLVNPDWLEGLEESVDILSDAELVHSIRRSRQEAAAGRRSRLG